MGPAFATSARGRERQKRGKTRRFCLLGQRPRRQAAEITCARRAAPGPCFRQDRLRGPRHPRLQRVSAAYSGLPPSPARATLTTAAGRELAFRQLSAPLTRFNVFRDALGALRTPPLYPYNKRGPYPHRCAGKEPTAPYSRSAALSAPLRVLPLFPPLQQEGPRPPPLRWQGAYGSIFTFRGSFSAAPRSPPSFPSTTRGAPTPNRRSAGFARLRPLKWTRTATGYQRAPTPSLR